MSPGFRPVVFQCIFIFNGVLVVFNGLFIWVLDTFSSDFLLMQCLYMFGSFGSCLLLHCYKKIGTFLSLFCFLIVLEDIRL